jgi:glycerophosphodiester phosphodiesterase
MKFTVDVQNKGFKPNTRRHSVQDSFTTLEELLGKLPDSISFNIEISESLQSKATLLACDLY